ncbi:hypothetical protein C8F01DRAFT_1329392 [Mycena amicta]|nr:hypothetical protein C8F01DRAFT_1329392 [Mycena amicta]
MLCCHVTPRIGLILSFYSDLCPLALSVHLSFPLNLWYQEDTSRRQLLQNNMMWFAETFDKSLARSQVEDALAQSIGDVVQAIWDNLTHPIRARLNYAQNPLEKVQILFGYLDSQSGNAVLVHAFQHALSKWGGIDYMLNSHQDSTIQDEIVFIRNCPPPSEFFQGCEDILQQLDHLFQQTEQKEQKSVLLYGLGGAGKTQIALKFIANSGSRFTDQFKINASSAETIEAGYRQLAIDKKLGDTVEAARTWLKANQEEWLILFDNADKRDLNLGPYLPKYQHGNILITSRNPDLGIHTGLPRKAIQISDLAVDDASILLLNRAGVELENGDNQNHAAIIAKSILTPFMQWRTLLQTYRSLGRYTDAQTLDEKVLEQRARLLGSEHPDTIHIVANLAITYHSLGRYTDAQTLNEKVLEQGTRLLGAEHPDTIRAMANLAATYRSLGRYTNAQTLEEKVLEQQTRLLGVEHPDTIVTMANLAGTYCSLARYTDAQTLKEKVLEQQTRLLGVEHPDTIRTMANLAGSYSSLGKYTDAQTLNEKVLEKRTRVLGAEHPDTILTMANLAATYRSLRQYTDAQTLNEKVLEQRTRLLGAEHPDTIRVVANLAATYHSLGKYTDAQKLLEAVLEQQTRLLGAEHPDTIRAMANLAGCYGSLGHKPGCLVAEHPDTIRVMANLAATYRTLGRYTDAQTLEEKVLEQRTRLLGAEHPDTILAMANLAATYHSLGQYRDAQTLEEKVLEQRTRLLGAEHPDTIRVVVNLAATYHSLGKYTDARKLVETVLEQQTRLLGAEHPDTIRALANLAATYHSLGR